MPLRMAATEVQYGKPAEVAASEEQSATVIWLHGLGDSGRAWSKLAGAVGVDWAKWIFPTAPKAPNTVAGGSEMNTWYDMAGVGVKELRGDTEGIAQSVEYVHSLISAEIEAGTPAERIVLGGFSQGGCLALAAAFQYPEALGGVIGVSTWFPRGIADKPSEANAKLPVLLCHGETDPIAKVEWTRKAFDYLLEQLELPAEGNVYPGVGHEFSPSKLPDIKDFIQTHCPPAYKTKVTKPLGAVLVEAETPKGGVQVSGLKEGGNAAAAGEIQVGDQIVRVNGEFAKNVGFDAVMDMIVKADSEVELDMVRPIPDRKADWATLSEDEQQQRYSASSGVLKVCSDGPCSKQGAKLVIRWLTELTPTDFSVSRCSCTGNCGNGPNVVVGGKGREEKVMYGVNNVGSAVKMLREEFSIETDAAKVQQILNPSKAAEFALSDELVRQGILSSVTIRGSFDSNRF